MEKITERFRVKAISSFHLFYGNEHDALGGKPLELAVGAQPVEISANLAEYLGTFPGLKVEVLPNPSPKE